MSARVIEGKPIAAAIRAQLPDEVAGFVAQVGHPPGLATILVGDDPGSAIYVASKQRASAEIGMHAIDRHLPADASHEQVANLIEELNRDETVSGVLLQLPVPDHLDGPSLTALIDADKDVDGLTPVNVGRLWLGEAGLRPCTPWG